MQRPSSIRSKIWICVLVAVAGYFVATLSSFYSNLRQHERLSLLKELHFPLATAGNDLLHTFKKQTERYEDAFLTGENELAAQGSSLIPQVVELLTRIGEMAARHERPPLTPAHIRKLEQSYLEYSRIASDIYPQVAEVEFSLDLQKNIQNLGRMQRFLLEEFTTLDKTLSSAFVSEIDENKAKTLTNTFFLGGFFVLVLLSVTLIINNVSYRLLIRPLAGIQENVNLFARAQEINPPEIGNPADEIGHLATAFWKMTQDLKATTVSKKYVDNVIRHMAGGLVVTSPDGAVQTVNQRTLEMFGYQEDEILGQPINLLFAANNDPRFLASRIDKLVADRPVKDMEAIGRTKAGRFFPSHLSGAPMHNDQGKLEGVICVFNDITDQKDAEEKLKQMAHFDPLTGLANRNLFFERLETAAREAAKTRHPFALLYLDLDNFKPINDSFGHDRGDLILKAVAKRLQKAVRSGDTVARMGGDEFAIILNALQKPADAEALAEVIIAAIARPFITENASHSIGVSIGISIFPENDTRTEGLVTKADQAMYQAKEKGRNTFSRFCYNRDNDIFPEKGIH